MAGCWPRSILVIAPHADDEVLGCGGTMALAADSGTTVSVVVMAIGGIRHRHLSEASAADARIAELEACSRQLSVDSSRVLFPGKDMRLETLPMLDLVSALDRVLDGGDYQEVYIPQPSHNQDHRITYEAALTALRPGCRRSAPTLVALYEGTSTGWRPQALPSGRLYVDISLTMDKKMAALAMYRSQLQPFPHPNSPEAVKALSAMRGMECGAAYAEMFTIHRLLR